MRKISFILIIFAVFLLTNIASAIHFDNCNNGDLTVTYVNSDAGYDNAFGIHKPIPQEFGFIHSQPIGKVYPAGTYTTGSEVILYITTPDHHTYYTFDTAGDELDHTRVIKNADTSWTAGFEDMWEGGDQDYNDVILNVACKPVPIPTPEFPSMALPAGMIVGLLGIIIYARESNKI